MCTHAIPVWEMLYIKGTQAFTLTESRFDVQSDKLFGDAGRILSETESTDDAIIMAFRHCTVIGMKRNSKKRCFINQ